MRPSEIISIVSAVAFVGTAVFALIQVRHLVRGRNLEASMRLFEWGETERVRGAINWVLRKPLPKVSDDRVCVLWEENPEFEDYFQTVVSYFEQAGMLLAKGLVAEDIVVDHLGHKVIASWEKLAPVIKQRREDCGELHLGNHFEYLYRTTKTGRETHIPKVHPRRKTVLGRAKRSVPGKGAAKPGE